MRERLSKLLWTSILTVMLGASNLSAAPVVADRGVEPSFDRAPCYDRCFDNCYNYDPCCDWGLSVAFDWLYWNICQSDDLQIGIRDTSNSTTNIVNGTEEVLHHNYHSGFRLGLGWRVPCGCDPWDLAVIWTQFHHQYHHRVTAPVNGSILPTELPAYLVGTSRASEAEAGLKFKYDLVDILISKSIRCGDCVKIRPYLGARLLFSQEKYTVGYTPLTGPLVVGNFSNWDNRFDAYGVTLGSHAKYHVCDCVSLIGHVGASILGGDGRHHQRFLVGTTFSEVRGKHCEVIGGWDASIGLAYDTTCCNCPIYLAVGYEVQDWYNMPRPAHYTSGVTGTSASGIHTSDEGGRLTLHGAFLRIGTSF